MIDRHRARGGDRLEVRDDPGFRRAHVVRHDDERADDTGRARERLRSRGSSSRCCSFRCRRSRARPAAAHARAHASTTARFSSAVERGRLAGRAERDDAADTRRRDTRAHRRSIAPTSTAPSASNGVMSGTQTPRRSRSLVMRRAYFVRRHGSGESQQPRYVRLSAAVALRSFSPCWSASPPACSRGCSASAARSSRRPAIRALGATALQAIGSHPAVDLPVVDLGIAALPPREDDRAGASWSWSRPRSASPRRSRARGHRASIPGNGHLQMILTAALVGSPRTAPRSRPRATPSDARPAPADSSDRVVAAARSSALARGHALGPARRRRRHPHGAGVPGVGRHAAEGDDRDVARVRRASSRSPARSRTGTSATSTGSSRSPLCDRRDPRRADRRALRDQRRRPRRCATASASCSASSRSSTRPARCSRSIMSSAGRARTRRRASAR